MKLATLFSGVGLGLATLSLGLAIPVSALSSQPTNTHLSATKKHCVTKRVYIRAHYEGRRYIRGHYVNQQYCKK